MSAAAPSASRRGPGIASAGLAIAGAAALAGFAIAALASKLPVVALLGVLGAAGVVAIVVHPQLTATIVVGLIWVDLPVVAVRDHGMPYIAGAALPLLLGVVIARDLCRGKRLVLERGAGWVAALILVATLSAMLSTHQDRAVANVATLVAQGAVLYLLVVNALRSERAVRAALWAVIGAGSWLALVAIVQNATQHYDQPFWGFAQLDLSYARGLAETPRAFGPLGDPNYFVQILLPVLAFALVALRFELTRARRALAGGAFLLTLAAIGYTGSRGAIVAMVLMLVTGLGIGVLRMRHAVVAALLGVALVLAIPGYRDRVQTIVVHPGSVTASAGDDAAADDSSRARATESLAALLAWEDHPLLGTGPGVFPLLYQQYAPRVGYEVHNKGVGTEAGQAPTREAHNLYLGIAADTGMLGLAAFLGLVGAVLVPLLIAARRLRGVQPRLAHCAAALALAIVGYLGSGLFLSLAYERYFWLLFGLGAATARLTRRRLRAAGPASARAALHPAGALDARTT